MGWGRAAGAGDAAGPRAVGKFSRSRLRRSGLAAGHRRVLAAGNLPFELGFHRFSPEKKKKFFNKKPALLFRAACPELVPRLRRASPRVGQAWVQADEDFPINYSPGEISGDARGCSVPREGFCRGQQQQCPKRDDDLAAARCSGGTHILSLHGWDHYTWKK